MNFLQKNIRTIVFVIAAILFLVIQALPQQYRAVNQVKLYSLCAVVFLYLTLLVSPLYNVFPNLPYKALYLKARKALGVSAFFFALSHAWIGFFDFVGGFAGLQYWSLKFNLSLLFGFIALCILAAMASTSPTKMVKKMGKYWKPLHRFVYLAGLLILIHATTITVSIVNLKPIMVISYVFLIILFFLESVRFDRYITSKYIGFPKHFIVYTLFPISAGLLFWAFFFLNHHSH